MTPLLGSLVDPDATSALSVIVRFVHQLVDPDALLDSIVDPDDSSWFYC